MKAGVLALQGASRPHLRALRRLDMATVEVRTAADLDVVDRLVMPGGESTTISMMLERNALFTPLAARLDEGMPVLGTCAGLILLARQVLDGRADQLSFSRLDAVVRRNGYGRQLDSFETELRTADLDPPFPAVFIRAPVVESVGAEVEVLARVDGRPVLVRQGAVLASTFHPELSDDLRIHRWFVDLEPGPPAPPAPQST